MSTNTPETLDALFEPDTPPSHVHNIQIPPELRRAAPHMGFPPHATILLLGSQLKTIPNFFLARNICIARDRAWNYTVQSRGKGPEFFQPYVEEWSTPPVVDMKSKWRILRGKVLGGWVRNSWLNGDFEAKRMPEYQVAVFMHERKWDYSDTSPPLLFFPVLPSYSDTKQSIRINSVPTRSISNRIGPSMWAHDDSDVIRTSIRDRYNVLAKTFHEGQLRDINRAMKIYKDCIRLLADDETGMVSHGFQGTQEYLKIYEICFKATHSLCRNEVDKNAKVTKMIDYLKDVLPDLDRKGMIDPRYPKTVTPVTI
ncbi:hypothetical protein BDQ17DRAFT_1329786 [Cyathus striatus]|nr:hypothetical protein BDQ17DRAFT_1329786 [Cyathus striatus]